MKFFKMFRKDLSVAEMMDKADKKVWKDKHGKRKFICKYAVVNMDDGFKTVADGFKTKADAKAYCETCNFNWFINPYWEQA